MSYYSSKSKQGLNEFETPLDSLFIFLGAKPTSFETTASVSLEVCTDRLSAMEEKPGWAGYFLNRRSIKVELFQVDESTCQFRLLKKQNKRLPIVLSGYMERLSDSSTLITGSAQSQHLFWQMVIPFAAFFVFFIVLGLIQEIPSPFNVFFSVAMTLVLGISAVMTAYDRAGLIDFLEDKLTRPEVLGSRKKKVY